ncbi:hypothetical protein BASA81_006770 [Batrachochytrium salamandrivorans]|nr:hypothetical protein BASA81_006770 [Batrachochytrium salamandrivorans]
MKKRIWFELPVRRDLGNDTIIDKLRREYPVGLVNGLVMSDRAAGLPHFCDVEEILSRRLVERVKQQFPELEVVNLVRTGDRCNFQLDRVLGELEQQGTSKVVLVSGHEYRTSLLNKSLTGKLCDKRCGDGHAERNVLCGVESTVALRRSYSGKLIRGAVCSNPKVDFKPQAAFTVTQIAPLRNTADWLDQFPQPVVLTIMPMLSMRDLQRVSALGALDWQLSPNTTTAEFTPQMGLELAKQALQIGLNHAKVKGIYLYSPSPPAVMELTKYML